jgi:hypothetical protein
VPITIAVVYASIVTYVNTVNAKRKYKPWAISQTNIFKLIVIIHNAILAVYSAWTCVGMVNALYLSFAGWNGQTGLAGALDSLCKIHGPRGLGNAAIYNETSSAWSITNRAFHLAADGLTPERTDVGRIWNEGLAFYGWLFYLSKFYEVIDTAIILAKGKKSSFLQTYHHAGAMLCMWAGIRYMSPPIWMFVLVNSGIHAIMYTFYLCTVIRVPVPKKLKQTLTTMQITQFVVGASYAFAHLFIAYRVPVSVPYIYHLGSVVSQVASEARSDFSSATSSAVVAFSTAGMGAWLKKAALRAAGREGLAENVLNDQGRAFGVDAVHIVEDFISREEVRFRDELHWTHCLDTSGQAFAILLNCLYLAPLTWLFVQFFITAYLKRQERRRSSTASEKAQLARQSFQDASKGFARRMGEAIDEMHAVADDDDPAAPVIDTAELKKEVETAKDVTVEKVSETATEVKEDAEAVKAAALQKLNEGVERARKLKEDMGGSSDSFEQLQKKRAESLQRMRQSRSRSRDSNLYSPVYSPVRAASPRKADMSPIEPFSITEKLEEFAAQSAEKAEEVLGKVGEKAAEVPESIQEMAAVTAALENLESDSESEPEQEAPPPIEDYAEEYAEEYAEDEPHYEEYAEDDTEGRPLTPIQEGSVEDQSSPALTNRARSEVTPSPNEDGTGVEEASGARHPLAEEVQLEPDTSDLTEEKMKDGGTSEVTEEPVEKTEDDAQEAINEAPSAAENVEKNTKEDDGPAEVEKTKPQSPEEEADQNSAPANVSEGLKTPIADREADAAHDSADPKELAKEEVVTDNSTSAQTGQETDHTSPGDTAEAQTPIHEAESESETAEGLGDDEEAKKEAEDEDMSFIESPSKELDRPQIAAEEKNSDVPAEEKAAELPDTKQPSDTATDPVPAESAEKSETAVPQVEEPSPESSANIKGESSSEPSVFDKPEEPLASDEPEVKRERAGPTVQKESDASETEQSAAEASEAKPAEAIEDDEISAELVKEDVSVEPKIEEKQEASLKEETATGSEQVPPPPSESTPAQAEDSNEEEAPEKIETSTGDEARQETQDTQEPVIESNPQASSETKVNSHSEGNGIESAQPAADERSPEKESSKPPSMKSKSSLSLKSSKGDNDKPPSSKAASLKSKSSLSLSLQQNEDDDDKENQRPSSSGQSPVTPASPSDVKSEDAAVRADTSFADAVKE